MFSCSCCRSCSSCSNAVLDSCQRLLTSSRSRDSWSMSTLLIHTHTHTFTRKRLGWLKHGVIPCLYTVRVRCVKKITIASRARAEASGSRYIAPRRHELAAPHVGLNAQLIELLMVLQHPLRVATNCRRQLSLRSKPQTRAHVHVQSSPAQFLNFNNRQINVIFMQSLITAH